MKKTETNILIIEDEFIIAQDISEVLNRYGSQVYSTAAVGVADAKVIPYLEHELLQLEIHHFNPAGLPLKRSSLYAFLKSLLTVMQNPTFMPPVFVFLLAEGV